jgi:hypothetical protein
MVVSGVNIPLHFFLTTVVAGEITDGNVEQCACFALGNLILAA